MAGDERTGRQRGSSQGQNPKTRRTQSVNERQEAEEGTGHTNAHIHLIIALLQGVCHVVLVTNVSRECALAGPALKTASS